MKKIKLLLLLIISASFTMCTKNDTIAIDYKKEIIKSVSDQIILPRINVLLEKTKELEVSLADFSTQTNEKNLINAQNKLTEITKLYAKLYAFNIGDIKDNFINRRINFWPVYNISIEKKITTGSFTKQSIANSGSATKNLPSLNYLLFKFNSTDKVLSDYNNSANRMRFLLTTFEEFKELVQKLNTIWLSKNNSFAEKFKNNTDKGLNSSFNQLFNGLYNVVDNCKVTKVGKPAGLERSSHVNNEIVENYYTGNSKELIYENILAIEELFFSKDITSISDYIKSVTKNNELNTAILTKINDIKNIITNDIKTPLKDAVSDDKENVKKLYNSLKELLVLLHNDVRSTLSIIITGTDNDGD